MTPITQRRRLEDGAALKPFTRHLALERAPKRQRAAGEPDGDEGVQASAPAVIGLDLDARTLSLSFSSEAPVERWFGSEVLSHDAAAADFSRLNDAAPLLFNHNMDDVIGVVERAWIEGDRRGHALVRFARTPRGDEVMGMVADGVLRNCSFMYRVDKYRIDSESEDPYYDPDATYTATAWMAYEVSIVSVPADQSVGVGRALATDETSVRVETARKSTPPQAIPAQGTSTTRKVTMNETTPVAEVSADAVMKAERDRVEAIVALSRAHTLPMDQTHSMITRGLSISEARGEVLENVYLKNGQKPVANMGHNPNPDLTDKEKRSYSFLRAVSAIVNGDWSKAGFEREVSNDIAKRSGKDTQGFFLPTHLPFAPSEEHLRAWRMMGGGQGMQSRAPYLTGTAGQGGNLVQTQLLSDQFIEVLRNQLVTAQLGARYLTGLTGNIDIPRQITQTAGFWVAESGAPTEAEATFDKVSLRPKTVGALSKMSRLMLLQATPAIEMIAREDLLKIMALAIDVAALSGSGASNQPTGIVNQSGVGAVVGGANGANLSFDHIIQLQYATKFANAPQSATGYALNSKAVGYLSTQKATTGQYLWDPQGGLTNSSPDRLKGRQYAESQQLRSTLSKGTSTGVCSEIIYGNWQELLIAEWGVTEIMVNPYDSTGFTTGDVLIRAFQTMDIGVRHGASFSAMTDALTPGF
ncbi:MAG: phage major capsid protein [Leptothrix sp. (in: b-proteobacteria)]